MLAVHGGTALFVLGAAIVECYYLSNTGKDYYYGRMIAVAVSAF